MLVKEMDEASIQAIGHAVGYYDYGPEKKGLIACFRSPDAAAEYICGFVRCVLADGFLHTTSERIAKLDYVLPKARLYRGFGALTLGGITGTVAAVVILLCMERTALPVWMLGGGALCAVFAGLLFREYHPVG